MARSEIAEKITDLLSSGSWDEPRVVYLFVQLRKLLDHAKMATQQDLPHLRFYCDWLVHISKDRIDPITLAVVKDMEESIEAQIKTPYLSLGEEAISFAYFRSLRSEVIKLMKSEAIPTEMMDDEDAWVTLVGILVKVLENQPLNIQQKYKSNLKQLVFLPSAPGCVIMRIDFYQPVADRNGTTYPYYTLKNAY